MVRGWGLKSHQECLEYLGSEAFGLPGGNYCNATWDSVLCWPATAAGKTVELPCPPIIPLDQSKFAYRVCDVNGSWEGISSYQERTTVEGWTNYTQCFTEMTREFYFRIIHNIPIQQLKTHAFGSRVLETIGLLLSIISLTASTFIFYYFRSIRTSHRIRIHRSLFLSVMVYTTVLLVKNFDQLIAVQDGKGFVIAQQSICSKPILCETLVALVEFTKTAMFSWMLIQGLHLKITLSFVFNVSPNYKLYHAIGWGTPIVLTSIWAIVNGLLNKETCWYAYTHQKYFWVLEGPRIVILLVNLYFLASVIRMLVTKMKQNQSPEKEQIKKAVKAMVFLLPLLGANNLLHCVWPPISPPILFALYCYAANFLSSFQGFFLSFFYCFLSTEVTNNLSQYWSRRRQSRLTQSSSLKTPSVILIGQSETVFNEREIGHKEGESSGKISAFSKLLMEATEEKDQATEHIHS